MSKWYGSITNRIDEGKNFTGREIRVGDDITMYYYSDCTCYFVTKVIDQKHIFVHKYEVCADHSKPGGMGHQDWMYFKTLKEKNEYLNSFDIKDLQGNKIVSEENPIENPDEEWVFRYGKWKKAVHYTLDRWNECLALAKEDSKVGADPDHIHGLARYYFGLNDDGFAKVMSGKEVIKYFDINKVSFGVRNYYYDWEF